MKAAFMRWLVALIAVVAPFVSASASSGEIVALVPYTVRAGDSLSRIAARYQLKVANLLTEEANPALVKRGNPDLIFTGEVIKVPISRKFAVAQLVQPSAAEAKPAPVKPLPAPQAWPRRESRPTLGEAKGQAPAVVEADRWSTFEESTAQFVLLAAKHPEWFFALVFLAATSMAYTVLASSGALWKTLTAKPPDFRGDEEEKMAAALDIIRGLRAEDAVTLSEIILFRHDGGVPVTLQNLYQFLSPEDHVHLRVERLHNFPRILAKKERQQGAETAPRSAQGVGP